MTRIKACGMFRPEDIDAVNAAQPDYCGFIVNFEPSHRNVSIDTLRTLSKKLSANIISVGVFVNEAPETIALLANEGTISMAQLHGSEDDAYITKLKSLTKAPIIQAFKVATAADIKNANKSLADYILLDSGSGSGVLFDWSLLAEVNRPFFLAGGLGPSNLADALERISPFAVDMSSGLETNRLKDPEKIKRAVHIAHAYHATS